MKKFFLLSLALASVAVANAQYEKATTETFKPGYSISLEWGSTDGMTVNARTGVGCKDMFFLNDYTNGTLKVYGKKGFIKDIKVADFLWVSTTIDEAGHILPRGTKKVWPGTGSYAGAYYPGEGDGDLMYAVDAETGAILNGGQPFQMEGGTSGRFDALGNVSGDVTSGSWSMVAVNDSGNGNEFFFSSTDNGCDVFTIKINDEFPKWKNATTGNWEGPGKVQTLGTAMYVGKTNEDGFYTELAMLPNNYLGYTSSEAGLGNNVQKYIYATDPDDEDVECWQPTENFYITPQHASIGGFCVFELAGGKYIVYPSGASGTSNAADALGIAEVAFADSPASDAELDKAHLIARVYPATTDAGAFKYPTKSNWTSYYVEPVEGDANSVYIYTFNQNNPMLKWKFTAPTLGGVNNVTVVDDSNAPVEYFNLQGMRVNEAENGIFIRRQGNKVSKVIR